jgi:hypothetical protein
VQQPSIADRIAHLERELRALRAEQRAEFVATIAIVVGPGVVFTAHELFQHRIVSAELAAAFDAADIHNARVLGKRLRALCGHGLDRVGADHDGAIWMVSE